MPVNGLLLTLSTHSEMADAARARIASRAEATMGVARDRWQPLAVDADSVKAARDFHEWLEALPGVEQVEVIYVGFDEPNPNNLAP